MAATRRVAVLIAASPVPAFFSQVAALSLSLRSLEWAEWRPSIHVYLGGEADEEVARRWLPHLADVELIAADDADLARNGIWAQSDAAFRHAPSDADVLLAMDADTFVVAGIEDVLDRVVETASVAGVIAHFPLPAAPGTTPRDAWNAVAEGIVSRPLEFPFSHSLVPADAPADRRRSPFYVNFGVVFFAREAFEQVADRYLSIRPRLMERMSRPEFSGQAALTLATAAANVRTWALPLRHNFPNDPLAEQMHPEELACIRVYHYLRTVHFDRHQIFTCAEEYARFLELELSGVNRSFRDAVRRVAGSRFPFA